MRALVVVVAVVISATWSSEAARAKLTAADADAIDAIHRQLLEANRALIATERGTPPSSPSFECYANAAEAAGSIDSAVDELTALTGLSTLLRHEDDIRIAEHFVAASATEVIAVAQAEENRVNGLEGMCSQDNFVLSRLKSLLQLIERARDIAASFRQRLPAPPR